MRTKRVGLLAIVIGICVAAALWQQSTSAQGGGAPAGAAQGGRGGAGRQGGGGGAGGGLVSMPVLMTEPSDKAAIFTKADLEKKYGEMEAAKAGAWRIVDGGTRTVNIRIGTNDAPQVHPNTVEFWVIMRGTGTVTTGGKLVDGKIVGGMDQTVGPGDVVYVPATVAHGLTATQPVTYVTTRYDIVPAK
jgi:mannose-6-phosphate isomerase-like protein (cupin superfamily)